MGCHPELAGAKSLSGDWPSRARLKLGQHVGRERERGRNKSAEDLHRKQFHFHFITEIMRDEEINY